VDHDSGGFIDNQHVFVVVDDPIWHVVAGDERLGASGREYFRENLLTYTQAHPTSRGHHSIE
jgi:hypothetical protein